jgi:ADP-heptose:LPS heptosyltransferase
MTKRLTGINKIAIFRALQLGDMLCAVPAFRALRNAYPDAEIVLLGLPWAASFVKRFSHYINRFIHFPGYEGLPEQEYDPASFHDFSMLMQQEQFDLILQMQGNGTIVNELLQTMGAKRVAGFENEESRMNSELFVEYPCDISEIERHLVLMEHLGIPGMGKELEFPITKKEREESKEMIAVATEHKPYICVHPGSRGAWRQWPPQYFAALVDYSAVQGFKVFVTGTTDERDITRELIKSVHHNVIDMTGKTSLASIAVLIEGASMLIANCTGVSHIASALRTPSFIISMDGEPERWSPLNRSLHHVVDWTRHPRLETVLKEALSFINKYVPKTLAVSQQVQAEQNSVN